VEQNGPVAVPGAYQVRLSRGEWTQSESFEVLKDPRLATTLAEFQAQFDLLASIRDRLQELNDAVEAARDVKEQVQNVADRVDDGTAGAAIKERARALVESLTNQEAEFVRVERGPVMGYSRPKLDRELAFVATMASSADTRPTDQALERYRELDGLLKQGLAELDRLFRQDVVALNDLVERQGVGPIFLPAGRVRGAATDAAGPQR